MSEQLDAVYDYMYKKGKALHPPRVCTDCGLKKQAIDFYRTRKRCKECTNKRMKEYNAKKRQIMTLDEILEVLKGMNIGAKSNFGRYLVEKKVFKNLDTALEAIKQYGTRKANSATFLKRQAISDHFKQWRYLYGGKTKHRKRFDAMQEYNQRLAEYWRVAV